MGIRHLRYVAELRFTTTAFIVAAIVLLLPLKTLAQNNRLKMADDLYQEYLAADKKHYTAEGVQMAEALYQKATQRNDIHARCAALSIPLYYYRKSADSANFYNAANRMKQVAREVGIPKYYYYAWRRLINNMLNYGKSREALHEALKMQKELKGKDEQSSYDIGQCYSIIGNIYYVRKDYPTAEKFFTQGLDYARKYTKTQDLSTFYQYLYVINSALGDNKKALSFAEEGLKHTNRGPYIRALTICKTEALFYLNRINEFREGMKVIDKFVEEYGISAYSTYYKLKIYECILDKKYDEARKWVEKIGSEINREESLRDICKAECKWKEAYKHEKRRKELFSKDIESMKNNDLASLNTEFVNARLKADSAQLQVALTQTTLMGKLAENAKLKAEADRNRQALAIRDLTIRNYAVADSLRTIEMLRQKDKSQLVEIETEKKAIMATSRYTVLAIVFATLLAVVAFVLAMLFNSRRHARRLTEKDERLRASLEKAKESERMKNIFVENISNVIGEPLDVIVKNLKTFRSNTDHDNETTKQCLDNMHESSAKLTTMINDMLALANEQSEVSETTNSNGAMRTIATIFVSLAIGTTALPHALPDDSAYWHKMLTEEEHLSLVHENMLRQQQQEELKKMEEKFDNEQLRAENQSMKLANAKKKLEIEQAENTRLALEAENNKAKITSKDLSLKNMKAADSLKSSELQHAKAKYQLAKSVAEKQTIRTQRTYRLIAFSLGGLVIIILFLIMLWRKSKTHVRMLVHKNRQLIKAKREVEKSNAEKAAFINNVSHEIRTPLNAIIGFTDVLADSGMKLSHGERQEYSDIINRNANLLSTMTENIVMLSQLQAGKMIANPTTFHVNKVCLKSLAMAKVDSPKNIEMIFTTNIKDDDTFVTDERLFSVVIDQLLSNAKKFTRKGSITLNTSFLDDKLQVTVTDTGCGIPKDKQDSVFEAFNKVDIYKQGIGVGLHICRLIADLLHGDISVDATYTNGTRIILSIESL